MANTLESASRAPDLYPEGWGRNCPGGSQVELAVAWASRLHGPAAGAVLCRVLRDVEARARHEQVSALDLERTSARFQVLSLEGTLEQRCRPIEGGRAAVYDAVREVWRACVRLSDEPAHLHYLPQGWRTTGTEAHATAGTAAEAVATAYCSAIALSRGAEVWEREIVLAPDLLRLLRARRPPAEGLRLRAVESWRLSRPGASPRSWAGSARALRPRAGARSLLALHFEGPSTCESAVEAWQLAALRALARAGLDDALEWDVRAFAPGLPGEVTWSLLRQAGFEDFEGSLLGS